MHSFGIVHRDMKLENVSHEQQMRQMNVLKEDISRRAQGRSQQALTMSLFTVS